MSQRRFMGVDGGGSTLRVVITNDDLQILSEFQGSTANPNIIGYDNATDYLQKCIRETLAQTDLEPVDITSVGIGIAGASNSHSERWLIRSISPALPKSLLVPSSDLEIALVGALGQRHGILILAGTGSAVFGQSPDGNTLQLGGWGYLLGDEGSGYWIGVQALKRIIKDYEEDYAAHVDYDSSSLNQKILDHLELKEPRDLINWLYRTQQPPVTRIAPLTRLIFNEAESGNWDAMNLLQAAAIELSSKAELMVRRLNYPDAPIAFAGGLLNNDNCFSRDLTVRLDLPLRPIAKYPPVVGGALLAQLEWKCQSNV